MRAPEVAPYLKFLAARRRRNKESDLWSVIAERWCRLVEFARSTAAAVQTSPAIHRPTITAAEMLLKVAPEVSAERATDTIISVLLLERSQPYRFKDHSALLFAVVRRLRLLAPMALGSRYCHRRRRTVSVYQEAPPRAVVILGQWLIEVFGAAAVVLKDVEDRLASRGRIERERMSQAGEVLR